MSRASGQARGWGAWAGPGAALVVWWIFPEDATRPLAGPMAAVAVWMAVWWLTEAVPLAATSLLPIGLFPLAGIADPAAVTGRYFNPIVSLFLGGFLIALAMERWDLHRRIALVVIGAVGAAPGRLVLGFMAASALLSMWISNTATATMMLPIALAVLSRTEATLDAADARRLGLGLLLGVAYGASIGGVATLVGTPTNLALAQILRDTFPAAPPLAFGPWLVLVLPFSVVMLAVTWWLLTRVLFRVRGAGGADAAVVARERAALGPMSREERVVAAVFAAAALAWTFRADLKVGGWVLPGWSRLHESLGRVEDGTVAICLAAGLFVIPAREGGRVLDARVFPRVPWDILLLFGGGFALAAGFTSSGLSAWLAGSFVAAEGLPLIATLGLACLLITFLTELTSNTATAQMFLPVLAAWASAHGMHPLLLMVPATISASMAFMLPVATPPNAIVFGSGRIGVGEMARAGLVLNVIGVGLVVVLCRYWLPVVFDFAPGDFPAWAEELSR